MRYYSEEDVSEMLAKEFDEACSYSKPYSGVKMSDYPSIEIPHSNWHTGTPTEDGYYLVHMTICDEEYDLCLDFKDGTWDDRKWGFGYNYKILAYQKIEPYKEASK